MLFPDPWWKKRHQKRRVFTPAFAADAARALLPGGRLLIASDVEEYFGVMTDLLRAMPAFREVSAGMSSEQGFQTNFERKAQLTGTPVWRAEYERSGAMMRAVASPSAPLRAACSDVHAAGALSRHGAEPCHRA